jgi:hypothetical protein
LRDVRAAVVLILLAACDSKPSSPDAGAAPLLHRTEGDLDITVRISSVKPSTSAGKAWIAQESLAMDVVRGKDYLAGPTLGCAVSDQKTFELRADAARALLAYRCKPGDAWVIEHVGETAIHLDCEAKGGTAAEPDLGATKTLLERSAVLAKCALDENLARMTRSSALLTLAVDVHRAGKSDARTAEFELVVLDELLAKKDDSWPRVVWDTEVLQGVNGGRQALPPTVYPEVQRQAVARLAKAASVNEIFALAAVADVRDPQFANAAQSAMKVLTAATRSGLKDAAVSLVIGPLIDGSPARASALGCEALGAGMTNGTAAFAVSRAPSATKDSKECPALKTALQAHPYYSKTWFGMKCGSLDREALTEMPKRFLDDKWKRKTLSDAAFNANPHDLIDWEQGLLTATCPKP